MNHILHRLLSLVLAMLLVLGICANPATVYAKEEELPRYGRSALAEMKNAKALLYAYDQIVEGVENAEETINIYNGKDALSKKEIETVMDVYRRDYGEHFWLDNQYSMMKKGDIYESVSPAYIMTGDALNAAKKEFRRAVDTVLSGLEKGMSDFEKEQYIHDKLAARITYKFGTNAHNAYGALVEGEAVCEGYAESFQYLLRRAGIQSFLAVGSDKRSGGGHEWNYVRLDGEYYHVDLTWNDQGNDLYHAYFNVSDEMILEDHIITSTAYALPECDSDDAFFFEDKPEYLEEYTAKTVGKLLKDNDLTVHVFVPGNVEEFIQWYQKNIVDIAIEAEMYGYFNYGYSCLGREVILRIQPPHTHDLTFVPAVEATCTTAGNVAYYICECGGIYTDKKGENEIADPTVDILGHDYSEKITDKAHFREKAANCVSFDSYWYDCSRCAANAKNDPNADDDCWYDTETAGKHDFQMKQWGYQEIEGHAHVCSLCEEHDAVKPHIPGDPATEELPQVCTECSFVLAPALSHVHELALVEAVAATCTEAGYTAYYTCSGCPYWFADEAGTQLITDKTTLVVDALGHSHGGYKSNEDATCTADGTKTGICENCGEKDTVTDTGSALGHSYGDWVTEGEKDVRTCTVCKETEEREIQKPAVEFKDVPADQYYYAPVQWAVAKEITNGYGAADTFAPDLACTRGQIVTFLWRANGSPEPKSSVNPFTDVVETDYYYEAVLWAVENGITTGYGSDTIFNPNGECTRAQVATFLWRAEGEPAPASSNNPFTDVISGQYYYDAVLWAVEQGVTNGYGSETTYAPDITCTRGQIVTFLYRAIAE